MPEIPAPPDTPLPAWRTDPLPSGLVWSTDVAPPVSNNSYSFWDEPLLTPTHPSASVPRVMLNDFNSIVKYPRRMAVLRAWAAQHGLRIDALDSASVAVGVYGASVHYGFRVIDGSFSPRKEVCFDDTTCLCGVILPVGTLTHSCRPHPLACNYCGWSTSTLYVDDTYIVCSNCAHQCGACGVPINPDWDYCTAHGERRSCSNCGSRGHVTTQGSTTLCDSCWESRCGMCGDNWADEYYLEDYGEVCRNCYQTSRFGDLGDDTEEVDDNADVDDFTLPTIPGRESIRHCGLEIEGAGSSGVMIANLRSAGLTEQYEMNGYHHTSRYAGNMWSVESDSSVDWELVSPKLNMAEAGAVDQLNAAVQALRTSIRGGDVSLDLRCGLHIHIAAAQIPVGGAYKLKGYWDYLEDVMFRLGAAKWPIHRAIINGGEFTRNTPKSGMSNKLDFARHYERNNDRYFALSFANYFRAFLENCQCGAVRYDTWDNCVCDLGKCTFEFRVFNTSANPTKIHAYLALCQALVAKAAQGEDVEDIQRSLPPQAFNPVVFKKADSATQGGLMESWEPRLRWIFNELPLTDSEKRSIMYCVENSELANLDPSFVRSLNPNQFAMEVEA